MTERFKFMEFSEIEDVIYNTAITITDNFPKFRVYPSTNVGVIQARTCCDTNLTKSPSKNSDPLDRFF
jgi:hypothetical protein